MGQAKRRREGLPTAPPAPRSRISGDDAAYLRAVRLQAEQAAQAEQQAQQLEAQAAGLRQRATALYGAHESFVEHLCAKYGLDKETDRIDAQTGAITRASGGGETVGGLPVIDLDLEVLERAQAPAEPAPNGQSQGKAR